MPERLVLLAAGSGSRLRESIPEALKPLTPVGGIPLIVRSLRGAQQAGIRRVDIVVGYRGDELRTALMDKFCVDDLSLRFIQNRAWNESGNGGSLLVAADDRSPCLLAMADHLFEDVIWRMAQSALPQGGVAALLIDRKIDQCFDLDDATKVRTEGALIREIGKSLPAYDALDCGIFSITGEVFEAMSAEFSARGQCGLSDGMRRLATRKALIGVDVSGAFWHDVDTEAALAFADKHVATSLTGAQTAT